MALWNHTVAADQRDMFTSIDSAEGGVRASRLEVAIVPTGPKGLWGALARVATPGVVDRQLPVSDMADPLGRSMFDYDHTAALPLGDDVAVVLGVDETG